MNQPQLSRRHFLQQTLLAATAGPYLAVTGKAAPSERVRLGFIACGGRAKQMMPMFASFPDVDIVAVSDVIEPRIREAAELLSKTIYPHKPDQVLLSWHPGDAHP